MAKSLRGVRAEVRLSVSVPAALADRVEEMSSLRKQSKKVLYEEALQQHFDSGTIKIVMGKYLLDDLTTYCRLRKRDIETLIYELLEKEIEQAKSASPFEFARQQVIPFGPY